MVIMKMRDGVKATFVAKSPILNPCLISSPGEKKREGMISLAVNQKRVQCRLGNVKACNCD